MIFQQGYRTKFDTWSRQGHDKVVKSLTRLYNRKELKMVNWIKSRLAENILGWRCTYCSWRNRINV